MVEPILDVRGLTRSFGAVRASDEVSLDLRAGEIHAVIGPNGAGKSTLIGQICGGIRPDSGSVHLLGRDVTALGTAARARLGLARTFQVSALAPEDSVWENVALAVIGTRRGLPGFLRSVRRDTLLRTQVADALDRVGLGKETGRRASVLSHGERRRLEIAVALAMRPKAFVMDEPLAGLGAEGSAEIVELLDNLRNEAPILLVEHDMEQVFALADRVSVLVEGRIIATGPVDSIRADPLVRAAYLGDAA